MKTLPPATLKLQLHQNLTIKRKEGTIRAKITLVKQELFSSLSHRLTQILNPNEIKIYHDITAQKRKHSYLLGRYALKKATASFLYLDEEYPLDQFEIASAILEYPILKFSTLDLPDLTLTHSDHFVGGIAYQAGHVMGMDIEYLNPSRVKVFERVMTDREKNKEKSTEATELELVALHWTLKEALSKAVKCGFTVPFPILELDQLTQISPGHFETLFVNFGQYRGSAWIVGDHAIAIVYPKKSKLDWHPMDDQPFWMPAKKNS